MREKTVRAQNFLKEYDLIQKSCEIIDEQMFDISSALRQIGREDGGSENSARRVRSYRDKLSDELQRLRLRRELLLGRGRLIEGVVKRLPPNEKKVVERFFLSPEGHYATDDLIESIGFEKTQIYRIRSRALSRIADMIEALDFSQLSEEEACDGRRQENS